MAKALGEVQGAKVQSKVEKGTGDEAITPVTVELDTAKADVGDLAKAAAGAKTPHLSRGTPSAYLVLPAPGLTKANVDKVSDALKGIKGVDAKATKTEGVKKEILVKLDDKGGAKLTDIKKALADFTK